MNRKELLEWLGVILILLAGWKGPDLWRAYQDWKLSNAPAVDHEIADRVG